MRSIFKTAIVIWAGLEFFIFALFVSLMGLGLTLMLGLITSLVGFFLLGRSSRAILQELRQTKEGEGQRIDVIILGPARILAAILLILPGFLTDLIGLLLVLPGLGNVASGIIRHHYAPQSSTTLDLDVSEWRDDHPKHSSLGRGHENSP